MRLANPTLSIVAMLGVGSLVASIGAIHAQESTGLDRDQTRPPAGSVAEARRDYDTLRKAYRPDAAPGVEPDMADRHDRLLSLIFASDRLRQAEATAAGDHASFVAAFKGHLARAIEIEAILKAWIREKPPKAAPGPQPDSRRGFPGEVSEEGLLTIATHEREDAEILLDAAKQSREKAHALQRILPLRRRYVEWREALRQGRTLSDDDLADGIGREDIIHLCAVSEKLRGAEAREARTSSEFIAAFEGHLVRAREIEALVKVSGAARNRKENASKPRQDGVGPSPPGVVEQESALTEASRDREEAEQLLKAARQSEEKAYTLLRIQAARRRYRPMKRLHDEGRITHDRLLDAQARVIEAERMATDDEAQRLAALGRLLDLAEELESRELAEMTVGRGTDADVAEASILRIEAEIRLRSAGAARETKNSGTLERRLAEVERKLDLLLKQRKDR